MTLNDAMKDPQNWFNAIEIAILAVGAFFAIRQLRLQREEIHSNALREHRRHSMEIDARLAEFAAERQKVETTSRLRNGTDRFRWSSSRAPLKATISSSPLS